MTGVSGDEKMDWFAPPLAACVSVPFIVSMLQVHVVFTTVHVLLVDCHHTSIHFLKEYVWPPIAHHLIRMQWRFMTWAHWLPSKLFDSPPLTLP